MNLIRPIFSLLPILVVLALIVAVVVLVRRRREEGEEQEPGLGTVRRLYYYGISFVALMLAANGVVLLVRYVIDTLSGPRVISADETQLALGLALTLVGTPIWLWFWNLAQRGVRQFPAETRSLTRKVFLYLVLGVSLGLTAGVLAAFLAWALGTDSFNGGLVAIPVVWGGLFAYHWRLESREGQPTELTRSVRRLYVYLASLLGLVMLGVGVGLVLEHLLRGAYDALFATPALIPRSVTLWDDTMRNAVAMAIVGGSIWWWHWLRVSRGDIESVLRQVYLYLFAILGGAIAVVASLSVLLFGLLRWLIGGPGVAAAADHFYFLPGVVVSLAAGCGLWGYHWAAVRHEARTATGRFLAARRVYRYLVAALGLGTLAAGLVFLFSLFVGLVVPQAREELVSGDWWRTSLAVAVTVLMVGTPLWGFYWFGAQQQARSGAAEERAALSRRVFIYATFGVATLVTLGSLSYVLFVLFQQALEGSLSLEMFQEVKWGLGMLLTAGAVSVYYWLVLQEDRRALPSLAEVPTLPPVRKRVIALAPEEALPLVRRLESHLGYPVSLWRRLDPQAGVPDLTDEELEATRERIAQAPGDRVLLTIDASGVHLVPFDEG